MPRTLDSAEQDQLAAAFHGAVRKNGPESDQSIETGPSLVVAEDALRQAGELRGVEMAIVRVVPMDAGGLAFELRTMDDLTAWLWVNPAANEQGYEARARIGPDPDQYTARTARLLSEFADQMKRWSAKRRLRGINVGAFGVIEIDDSK